MTPTERFKERVKETIATMPRTGLVETVAVAETLMTIDELFEREFSRRAMNRASRARYVARLLALGICSQCAKRKLFTKTRCKRCARIEADARKVRHANS